MKSIVGSLVFVAITYCASFSQKTVDIRLVENHRKSGKECFDIELRSPFGQDVHLAGQNYRLFYDASKLHFEKESPKSYLDPKAYTPVELINTTTSNIGFISMSMDGRELNEKVAMLPGDGTWVSTSHLCFENKSVHAFDLTWAHPDRTYHFASASVALSEWLSESQQQVLEPNEVYDFSSYDRVEVGRGLDKDVHVKCYPNPVVDFINVEINNNQLSSKLIIKDVIGREVVFDHLNGRSKFIYDLTNWPDGMYTLEMINDSGQLVFSDQVVKSRK